MNFRNAFALPLLFTIALAQEDKPWSAFPAIVEAVSQKRIGFNFKESEIPEYSLPDPLVMEDGIKVSAAEQWESVRRPEILNLFRQHVYGHRPDTDYQLDFEQTAEIKNALDGKATGQSLTATVTIGERSFSWPFVLFIPKGAKKPVPAVVLINNRYFIPLEKAATEHDPFWSVRQLVERGYATASFYTSDVDPDDKKEGYPKGIRAFFANGAAPEDNAWRSLSAWGWAASRVLDHLASLDAIDAGKVAVVGHSRGGKTSLWAAAEDSRFAIAYSNNSGCGGAALSRRAFGETVARISTSFPHWFCANFAAYGGKEAALPVDQHELIALIAPRAVYIASANEDLWADPRGEYTSLVEAAPVFELLGSKSITTRPMPALDQQRVAGRTGYHIRSGEHNLKDEDWRRFLDFADGVLK